MRAVIIKKKKKKEESSVNIKCIEKNIFFECFMYITSMI